MAALVCLLLVPWDSQFYAGAAPGSGGGDIEIQRVAAVPAIFTLRNFASKEECVAPLLLLIGLLSSKAVGCTSGSHAGALTGRRTCETMQQGDTSTPPQRARLAAKFLFVHPHRCGSESLRCKPTYLLKSTAGFTTTSRS